MSSSAAWQANTKYKICDMGHPMAAGSEAGGYRLLASQEQLLLTLSVYAMNAPSLHRHHVGHQDCGCLRCPGVQLKGGAVMAADLVIDASGRRSKVQAWLEEGGYSAPVTVEVDPGVGYSSAIFDVPPEVWSS